MTIDQTLYFVECAFASGNAFVEVERSRMSRREVIDDIAHGQYENVVTVLECNPVEHICDDVTEDFLREAAVLIGSSDELPLTGQNLQDSIWDHSQDYRKHEAA